MGHVSASYQEDPPQFSDSRSAGASVATTADGICTFTLTNTLGERASLVDAIAVSCGSPNRASVLTQSESLEEAAYLDGIVKQFAGPAALNSVDRRGGERRRARFRSRSPPVVRACDRRHRIRRRCALRKAGDDGITGPVRTGHLIRS